MTYFVSISRYLFLYIYILLVQEEDCTMREAQSLSTEARLATGIELSIHSAISRAQLDALSPFKPLIEIRVALWRAHSIYDFAFMDDGIALTLMARAIQARWTTCQYSCTTPCWVKASLLIQFFILTLKNESNLPKDVIYSLSLSIYGKNCTHAMIFKSFLLKWNSDFRTISYKRMEIHHFAMKTT
ncbi:hypothetical protein ACJX0J_013463 [Zea mays]